MEVFVINPPSPPFQKEGKVYRELYIAIMIVQKSVMTDEKLHLRD